MSFDQRRQCCCVEVVSFESVGVDSCVEPGLQSSCVVLHARALSVAENVVCSKWR